MNTEDAQPHAQPINKNDSCGDTHTTAHILPRQLSAGLRDLHKSPSTNLLRVFGRRQTNLRTYGSQRVTGDPSANSQLSKSHIFLQLQLLRRFPKSKDESQNSMTFSPCVVTKFCLCLLRPGLPTGFGPVPLCHLLHHFKMAD